MITICDDIKESSHFLSKILNWVIALILRATQ